ncbi:interferon alpha-inducible protein 27-like protein 2 [Aplysia californica]|uniref:Interferon alpha-inducible protein 27-like protein 2 n=1 Tax=Aplysia californica TaxID=6500 RepID=A0ABM1ACV8_APLCA|nr:interferon alpha-inducible protein 27-like protein 2 [Aplysia californica]
MSGVNIVVMCAIAAGGAVATAVVAPAALGVVGFGSGGIAAGSLAAKIMSLSWTTGYGVAAVGAAQSVGAAGVSASTATAVGTVCSAVWGVIKHIR